MKEEYGTEEGEAKGSPPATYCTDIDTNIIKNDLEPIPEDETKIEIKDGAGDDIENNFEANLITNSEDLNYQDKLKEDIDQQEKEKYNIINSEKKKKLENTGGNKKYSEFNKKQIKLSTEDDLNNETIKNNENEKKRK